MGLCTVWSQRDALQLQNVLDAAGIPFYVGPEKATSADQVTSSFADGVSVNVMRAGYPWARERLSWYEPKDEPPEENLDSDTDLAIHCPRCHSTDVVFEHLSGDSEDEQDGTPQKFAWACASCGHEWEDDGVESKR